MKEIKKKMLIYGISAAVAFLAAALLAGLVFDQGAQYSIFWGMLFAGLAMTIARIAYHLAIKDYAPEMWQISVYMLLACAGWFGGIMSLTWGWASLFLAVMVGAVLMAAGTRFCRAVAVQKTTSSLERTLRYRYVDDRLGGTLNLDAPLLLMNGTAMTVEEAALAGASARQLQEARAYIAKITGGK